MTKTMYDILNKEEQAELARLGWFSMFTNPNLSDKDLNEIELMRQRLKTDIKFLNKVWKKVNKEVFENEQQK